MKQTCHVANSQCEAPAGWRVGSGVGINTSQFTKLKCDVCGEPVCSKCSTVKKKIRTCDDCADYKTKA